MISELGCGAPMVANKKVTYLPKIESPYNEFKKVDYQCGKEDLEEAIKLLKKHGFIVHNTPHCLAFYKEGR